MTMIVHIILALASIVQVTYTVFSPTKSKLQIGYLLILSTIISGFIMATISSMSIGQVCVRGGIYLGIMIIMLVFVNKRIGAITK